MDIVKIENGISSCKVITTDNGDQFIRFKDGTYDILIDDYPYKLMKQELTDELEVKFNTFESNQNFEV